MPDAVVAAIDHIVAAHRRDGRGPDLHVDGAMATGAGDVQQVIDTIRDVYHRNWVKDKLEFARQFLARTWGGIPLPVLSVCGHGTQEIRYTNYLAYFLDGSKPHGVGTGYLNALLSTAAVEDLDTYGSVVETDKWLGQAATKKSPVNCYCDIVVSGTQFVVFIENKIRAGESSNPNSQTTQLRRYDEAIGQNPEFQDKKQIKLFLTPAGNRKVRCKAG